MHLYHRKCGDETWLIYHAVKGSTDWISGFSLAGGLGRRIAWIHRKRTGAELLWANRVIPTQCHFSWKTAWRGWKWLTDWINIIMEMLLNEHTYPPRSRGAKESFWESCWLTWTSVPGGSGGELAACIMKHKTHKENLIHPERLSTWPVGRPVNWSLFSHHIHLNPLTSLIS
jgi:hypothetical protein